MGSAGTGDPPVFFSSNVFGVHLILVRLISSTSVDASQLAAAREDGPLEVWLFSPCSIVLVRLISSTSVDASQLAAAQEDCPAPIKSNPSGHLFSSSIDGSILDWDLFSLKQKKMEPRHEAVIDHKREVEISQYEDERRFHGSPLSQCILPPCLYSLDIPFNCSSPSLMLGL
ncbi:hypothetical protein MRB53_028761 [Persea americana]|uniref:Uncharacterized protein n=1 Tax=Persea americana TaxID=3435 RepID=A0ACC2KGE2_PERAE|nr:hypothetical protein MRB53_028761 [Persea americana]